MGQRLSTCVRRHRNKLLIIGGIIGSAAFLNTYLRRKLSEWEKRKTLEYVEQLKRQGHFEGTIQTCDQALLPFMPKIREVVTETVNVYPIVEELKNKPPNKIELWEELKIVVFTQIVTEVYAQCLLVVLLRVQISILSGYIYADFQKNSNSVQNSPDYHQKYLSHTANFVNGGGIKDLVIPIEDSVRKALRGTKLSDLVKLSDIQRILQKIYQLIVNDMSQDNCSALQNIAYYLMLSDNEDSNQNKSRNHDVALKKILSETKDVLECNDFHKVFSCCLEHGITMLMDRMSECYMHITSGDVNFSNPNFISIPFAKLIPMIHTVFENHKPNENGSLVYILLQEQMLKNFAANLYEAFSQSST